MEAMGKVLIYLGVILVIIGLVLTFVPRLPWFGNLPGDITIERERFTLYLPIATSILISIILSLVLYLFRR